MKNRLHIKNVLKKLSKKRVSLRDPQLMHPQREWVIGLVVSLGLFIFATFISVYIYFKNQAIDVSVAADDTAEVVYRETLVNQVLEIIKQRQDKLNSLNKNYAPVEVSETEVTASSTDLETALDATTLISE
ncbi:MAG: hypothetical protein AAB618_00335 [Patescibacteria group bacterium]